jgi:hypothetical protein
MIFLQAGSHQAFNEGRLCIISSQKRGSCRSKKKIACALKMCYVNYNIIHVENNFSAIMANLPKGRDAKLEGL